LTSSARLDIERINARMAAAGMRVLGLAWKTEEPNLVPSEGLAWIGLVGLADPIREGVREALTLCRRAGIRVIMLTGDQLLTAAAVAREAELFAAAPSRVLDASRPGIDGRRLGDLVRSVNVFARVSPAQKHHIVRRLQQAGEIVAMVGDGINDAPALRAADIGIAIGSGGTAVARDVADVVLADEDFGSLLGAIAQGRATHANTKKAVRFLLSTNLSEILVTLTALAGGVGRPLSPIQFLWMNLLSDVLPALALASEPPEPAIMDSGPLSCDTSVLSTPALRRIAADGVVLSAGTLGSYLASLARHGTGSRSSSVAFATLTGAQLLHAATCRSDSRPSWRALAENPAMLAAIATTLGLGTAAVSLAPLRGILGTSSLDRTDWTTVIAGALLPTLTAPLRERMAPRGPSHSYR
jgi:Ca2+-transporting ATPase